jgi:hypothetical protein
LILKSAFQTITEHINVKLQKKIVQTCFVFGGIFTTMELLCYLIYFWYIYNHDNKVAALVISKNTLKSRNKINAISMVGQVVSWIIKIWYFVLVGLLTAIFPIDLLREVSVLIKASSYFLIPFVQVLTSAPIMRYVKGQR